MPGRIRTWQAAALAAVGAFFCHFPGHTALAQSLPPSADDDSWSVPDMSALPEDAQGNLIRQGRKLVSKTYAHLGPEVPDPARRYAGNNLACRSCHLDAGTKKFGNPLWGLRDRFPQYSAEAGHGISIEERVNACMTRSMNGRALPLDAPEMRAMVAYIDFLSQGLPQGENLTGYGSGDMAELDRAADPQRGAGLYRQVCAVCHGPNGEGVRRSAASTDLGYAVPPLWGSDSFNDGAGMNRLGTLANFIHFNMPNGTSYLSPQIRPEDAWDIAAFVVAQPRPHRADLDRDYPDLLLKPVDTPYGPYADGVGREQHVFGPFAPIRAELARLKAADPAKAGLRPAAGTNR